MKVEHAPDRRIFDGGALEGADFSSEHRIHFEPYTDIIVENTDIRNAAKLVLGLAVAGGAVILAHHLHERFTQNNHTQPEIELLPATPVTLETA